jgi:hypothetical protein
VLLLVVLHEPAMLLERDVSPLVRPGTLRAQRSFVAAERPEQLAEQHPAADIGEAVARSTARRRGARQAHDSATAALRVDRRQDVMRVDD